MFILFPSNPHERNKVDEDFALEREAAQSAGFAAVLFHLESLQEGNPARALTRTPPASLPDSPLLYRGWMMRGEQYGQLHDGLRALGYLPVTDEAGYSQAHYLPLGLPLLQGETPDTVFMTGRDREQAWQLYQAVQSGDALIKDWVKSAKYRWREACFLPAHTTQADFERIFAAFLEERGSLWDRGVVLRRFHRLRGQGEDIRGMPLAEEYRLFFWNGHVFARAPFADEAEYTRMRPHWEQIAARFQSRFLTIDVAREDSGGWTIIETGDGGVSGLPLSLEPEAFYQALWQATKGREL